MLETGSEAEEHVLSNYRDSIPPMAFEGISYEILFDMRLVRQDGNNTLHMPLPLTQLFRRPVRRLGSSDYYELTSKLSSLFRRLISGN